MSTTFPPYLLVKGGTHSRKSSAPTVAPPSLRAAAPALEVGTPLLCPAGDSLLNALPDTWVGSSFPPDAGLESEIWNPVLFPFPV